MEDIVEKIRRKTRQVKRASPIDFLFSTSDEEERSDNSEETEQSPDLLNITHLGEVPLEELSAPVQKEVIELNTEDPSKIRYLRLIVALMESSNYDAAISAIMELSEGSCGSGRSSGEEGD